jgi:hypothetical protein
MRPNRVRYMREWALEYHEVPVESDENATGSRTAG